MTELRNYPVPVAGAWVLEGMSDGACNVYSPDRGLAFTIHEPLLMAVYMVLEGKESYTSHVALEAIGESDDGDVRWSLSIGNVVLEMNELDLTEFSNALKESCHSCLGTPSEEHSLTEACLVDLIAWFECRPDQVCN